jgi:anti-sigma-K factor RskA
MKEVSPAGDVVWSDSQKVGYMRFRGLPPNDPNRETYQLWIFDESQDDKTPIDGGVFDVNSDGEVIIPIDAKLSPQNVKMFAVTVEKPGGVVVSKREKIAALAKVETRTS